MIDTVYSVPNISQPSLLEGPIWHKKVGLLWVDIARQEIGCLKEERVFTYNVPSGTTSVSTIIHTSDGWNAVNSVGLWAPTDYENDLELSERTLFPNTLASNPKIRTNDGKVGLDGALWVGTMADPPIAGAGVLYRIAREDDGLSVQTIREGVTISNGIAWSSDGSGFYYIDTPRHSIEFAMINYQDKSKVSFKIVMNIPPSIGDPDGMTIDQQGFLYVALWGGHAILVIDPTCKKIVDKLEIPAKYVTSCIFGGPEYNVLYVTTATWAAAGSIKAQPSNDMGGSIFAISGLGNGMPEPRLRLKA